jgi:uncharacterized membrane protein YsdA (DUF1294 family)/cold shock CspA family protein
MRHQGRITVWKDDRGFGFITPDAGGAPIFVHISGFKNRGRRPQGNEVVTYEVITNGTGKIEAMSVLFAGERRAIRNRRAQSLLPLAIAWVFSVLVGLAAFDGWLSPFVPALYLAASVFAFVAYGFDKGAAERNVWRIKESTLHLFGLVGGWPGAVVAQRYFRHKSSKSSFQFVFWTTVVINCAVLGWLITPSGAEWMQSISGWLYVGIGFGFK